VVRHDPILEACCERPVAAGNPQVVALVAAARKLLDAIIRGQEAWRYAR